MTKHTFDKGMYLYEKEMVLWNTPGYHFDFGNPALWRHMQFRKS
jgi:hypothetical protein